MLLFPIILSVSPNVFIIHRRSTYLQPFSSLRPIFISAVADCKKAPCFILSVSWLSPEVNAIFLQKSYLF